MRSSRFSIVAGLGLVTLLAASPGESGTLWLGGDGGASTHITTSGVLLGIGIGSTGVAWDGTSLYFDNGGGTTTRTAPDGSTILGSIFTPLGGSPSEDLAWDTTRDRLWRIDHFGAAGSNIHKIDPLTGADEATFFIPASFDGFDSMGGLGIAYDSTRDLLYASFCHAGCTSLSEGIVLTVDPTTGTLSTLFKAPDFATGGLAYDPGTDTLWIGDSFVVRNVELDGTVLDTVARPLVTGFVDGLEFIAEPVPEPGGFVLLGSALTALALLKRRR